MEEQKLSLVNTSKKESKKNVDEPKETTFFESNTMLLMAQTSQIKFGARQETSQVNNSVKNVKVTISNNGLHLISPTKHGAGSFTTEIKITDEIDEGGDTKDLENLTKVLNDVSLNPDRYGIKFQLILVDHEKPSIN